MGDIIKDQLTIVLDSWKEKLLLALAGAIALILVGIAYNTWLISTVVYPDRSAPATITEFSIHRGIDAPAVGLPPVVMAGDDAEMVLVVDKSRPCRPLARLLLVDQRTNEVRSIRLPEWPSLEVGQHLQRFLFRVPQVPPGLYQAQGQVDYDCGIEGLQIVRSPQIALEIRALGSR